MVLWPTREYGLLVLNQWDGEQPDDLDPTAIKKIRPGNLAFGNDCLAVADKNELAIYVPPAFLIEERKKEVGEKPQSAAAWLRLAMAEADAGLEAPASTHFEMARLNARPNEEWQGVDMRKAASEFEHAFVLDLADVAPKEAADRLLKSATAPRFAAEQRLEAFQRLFYMKEASSPAEAIQACQTILEDASLRNCALLSAKTQLLRPARGWASAMIFTLIERHGAQSYELIEDRARQLLDQPSALPREAVLQQVIEQFPNSQTSCLAAMQLGRHAENSKSWSDACRAYEHYLSFSSEQKPGDALATARYARCLVEQRCYAGARQAYLGLRRSFGTQIVPAIDPSRKVDEVVSQRINALKRFIPSERLSSNAEPMERDWQLDLKPSERLLFQAETFTEFFPATLASQWAVFASGKQVSCYSSETGKPAWTAQLAFEPTFAASVGDLVVLSGRKGIGCIQLADGRVRWQLLVRGQSLYYAQIGQRPPEEQLPDREALSDFQFDDSELPSLSCLQGKRRLLTFAPRWGQMWQNWLAPGGDIPDDYPRGSWDREYNAGIASCFLLSSTGRLMGLYNQLGIDAESGGKPWTTRPLSSENKHFRGILVFGAKECIKAVDDFEFKEAWTHRLDHPSTLSGDLPYVVGQWRRVMCVVPRNHGTGLLRLDHATGKPLWSREVMVSKELVQPGAISFDDNRVYCAECNRLSAYSFLTGLPLWQAPLAGPSGQWQVVALDDKVFAYPAETQSTKFRFTWLGQTVEAEYTDPPEEKPGAGFPIVIHDAKTGSLLQRLNFMETKPTFRLERKRAAHVGLFPEMAMDYTPRGPAPTVFISPRRIVVALEGHAWGLTAGK
jgi:hypothetical protein